MMRSLGACATAVALLGMLVAADAGRAAERGKIEVLGEGTDTIYVARHGELWSLYTDTVVASRLFELLQAVGGPTYASLPDISHAVTLALHSVRFEEVLEKMLDGFNYSVHYRDGQIAHVRILNATPGREYKTARRTESRTDWTNQELGIEKQP